MGLALGRLQAIVSQVSVFFLRLSACLLACLLVARVEIQNRERPNLKDGWMEGRG